MSRLIKLHIIFLIVALVIAFVLVPADMLYFRKVSAEEVNQYLNGAVAFEDFKAWKILFTWFLGLSCGRLMLRALMR